MNYLKIQNPIDKDVKTVFLGEEYEVKANSVANLPADAAKRLKDIYPFLEDAKEVEKPTPKDVEKKAKKTSKK